jgi:enoyl-CoA hydratase/carnithine racemase
MKIDTRMAGGVAVFTLNDPPANTYSYEMMRELMLKDADPEFKYYFCLHANETLARFEQTPKIVIAALNGHTVGGGLEVAMAADIRIAKQGPGKVGLPEVALGVLPGTGGNEKLAGKSFADAVVEYATQFVPPNKASRAVGRMKRAVQSGAEAGFAEGLAIERELQQLLFQSADAKEGIAANLEKRKPLFKGE